MKHSKMEKVRIFGCCELRKGSIAFAWLQMMMIIMIIATLIAVMEISQAEMIKNPSHDYKYVLMLVKIGIAAYIVKAVTVICLTWGLIKKKYAFYQPWIVIAFTELLLQFLSLVASFAQMFYSTSNLKYFVGNGLVTALNCYIFYCICTVYNKDKDATVKPVRLCEEEDEESEEFDGYSFPKKEKNYL